MSRLYIFLPLFWGVSLFALLRGGRDERGIAVLYAISAIVSPLVAQPELKSFAAVEIGLLIVDFVLFFGVSIIALRSESFWPLWLTWMLGVTLIAHLSPLLGTGISRLVYAKAEKLWSYPQFILLGLATWQHHKRLTQSTAAPG